MRAFHAGATCCEHNGSPQHLADSIKTGTALMFGRVKPEDQMADCGNGRLVLTKCEVCTTWRIHKGFVPQFRTDGTIYQIDQRRNGEVPEDTIPKRLSGSIAPSTDISIAPTPRSFRYQHAQASTASTRWTTQTWKHWKNWDGNRKQVSS